MYDELNKLKHSNGNPLTEIYGKHDIMMFTLVRIRRNIIQDDIEGGSI